MNYQLIREPFILLETVDMLCRFVNGRTVTDALNCCRMIRGRTVDERMVRQTQALQEILEEVCRDLQREDPLLQYYFGQIATDCALEELCLARLMTYSFCTMRYPDFHRHLQEIRELWHDLQNRGLVIRSCGISGLAFDEPNETDGNLFRQIRALKLPGDFRIEIYEIFQDFDSSLDKLGALLEPLAAALEAEYRKRPWLMEGIVGQWSQTFQTTPPLDYLARAIGENVIYGASEETRVGFSLMNCDEWIYDMAGSSYLVRDANTLYLGSLILPTDTVRKRSSDLRTVSNILKTLADERRLEVLRRLSKDRAYCHQLAVSMDVDRGNMSRLLTILYNYGLVRQERENQRIYYRTDWETIHNYLQTVEDFLRS